ncbi:MAG TPA: cytochrome c3 family protein [Anaeromyxobacter sp.]|nr:cytochrome c3 family protein [Anaeromyxobacter sp.]
MGRVFLALALLAGLAVAAPATAEERAPPPAGTPTGAVAETVPRPPADVLPRAIPDALVQAAPPGDLLFNALPTAPAKVHLQTKYYGVVEFDHPAHLARKIHCATCHGSQPVGKIDFTPRIAHERCSGCHQKEGKGPTSCRGCHVLPPPAAPITAQAGTPAPAAPGPTPAAAPSVAPGAPGATPAAPPGAEAGEGEPAGPPQVLGEAPLEIEQPAPPPPFRRFVELGAAAGDGAGLAVQVSANIGRVLMNYSVHAMSGSIDRTVGLIGAGKSWPLTPRMELVALGVGGFDAVGGVAVSMFPALGGRLGIDWVPPGRWSLHASVTGIADLYHREVFGRETGGGTVFLTIATGMRL